MTYIFYISCLVWKNVAISSLVKIQENRAEEAQQPIAIFLPGEFPWTEKPGKLRSTDWNRVGYNWGNLPRMHVSQNEAIWVLLLEREKDTRILVPQ